MRATLAARSIDVELVPLRDEHVQRVERRELPGTTLREFCVEVTGCHGLPGKAQSRGIDYRLVGIPEVATTELAVRASQWWAQLQRRFDLLATWRVHRALAIKKVDGKTCAQDQLTSVIYGMPKAAAQFADEEVSVDRVAEVVASHSLIIARKRRH